MEGYTLCKRRDFDPRMSSCSLTVSRDSAKGKIGADGVVVDADDE